MHTLRVLTPDDWQVWRELRLAALTDAPEAFCATLAEWQGEGDTEERWRGRLSIPGGRDLVALLDSTYVGMVSGVPGEEPTSAGLISMWVSPQARGRGVGEALVGAVRAWAAERGSAELVLDVMPGNQPATRLYERAGFAHRGPVGPEPGAELRMALPLR